MSVSDILKKYIKTSIGAGIKATAGIAVPSAGALLNRVSSRNVGSKAVNLGKEVAQSTLRGYAGVGSTLTGKTLTPSTILQKKIYGTNEPLTAARSGSEIGIPQSSKFAAPVGFVLAAADLFPGGKGVKPALIKSLKVISKADDAADVLMKSLKLTREVAMKYADDAARFTDEKQLGKLIDNILSKEKPMGISAKNLVTKTDDVSDPLLTEARKYKSAEEFVSGQTKLFHGNSTEGAFKLGDQPTFLTPNRVQADSFANDVMYGQQRGGIGRVLEFTAKPGKSKAIEIPENIGYGIDDFVKKQSATAKAEGYRYVEFTHPVVDMDLGKFPVKVSLYPKEDLLTKSQLTDIWKKAQGATGRPSSASNPPASRPVDGQSQAGISRPLLQGEKAPTPQPQSVLKPKTQALPATYLDKAKNTRGKVIESLKRAKTSVLEYVQNTDERVRQLVSRKDVSVDDVSDPYLKMTLYSGRVADKIETTRTEIAGIVDEYTKLSKSLKTPAVKKQVSDYLYFRHAPERNLALGENAAGITTKEAQEGLEQLSNLPHGSKIKTIADKVQEINNKTLDLLRDSGVISKKLHTTLREKYKSHVPLNRIFEETEDIGSALSGRGFDVKSTGIKAAKGSERAIDDIFTSIVSNYEQAVLRAEKNIVDQATLAFVRKNKDVLGDTFQIMKPRVMGESFSGAPIMERTQDPTILQLFEDGQKIWIKIKDPQLAIALRGVGKEKLGPLLNAVGSFTRLYSGLATRFNPEFALPNKIRDLQETAVYLASQKGVGFKGAAKTVAGDPQSLVDVLDALRGKNTEGANLYNEMKSLGGTTGGFGLSTRKQTGLNLAKLEKLANSKTRKIGENLIEYVDNWNTLFEDSTRLSVYRQAIKQGLTKERAAALAKEASINFNRMGKGGPVINALWMFSNASIQGSVKMVRALKNPKVLGTVAVAVGGSVGAVNQWNDQVDPDWRDKVSKWDRLNGLPVLIPSEEGKFRYVTIPVSWGLKPIKVMADYAYDALADQDIDATEMLETVFASIIEAYNPTGGTDITSAVTPTILDVPVELARNQSWSGKKIRPDSDPNAPRDIQYFDSLGETQSGRISISLSELLQSESDIAISPADIKYAYDAYVGGAGRAVSKMFNALSGFITNKPIPMDEFPFVSRFYRETEGEEIGQGAEETERLKGILQRQSRERFEQNKLVEEEAARLSTLSKEQAADEFDALLAKDEEFAKEVGEIISDKQKGLSATERRIKQLGVENGVRAEYIYDKMLSLPEEERGDVYQSYIDKGLVTDEVSDQITELINNPPEGGIKQGRSSDDSVIDAVFVYAKAIGVDPATAFNRIFTNQRIRRVDGNTVIIERNTGTLGGNTGFSSDTREEQGASEQQRLDHIIPVQLGGSDSKGNVRIVSYEEWKSYTPVENYLGQKLRRGEISKNDAQRLIKDFKNGDITAEDVYNF